MWLAIMILPMIVSSEGIPHALRSLVVIPAVMIFAALGLEWIIVKISDWLRKKMEQYPEKREQLLRIKKELFVLLIIFLLAVAAKLSINIFSAGQTIPMSATLITKIMSSSANICLLCPKISLNML